MPRNNNRSGRSSNSSGRGQNSNWGVMEMARERPIAAATAAVGAAAAGLFLWSRRTAISHQLGNLSDQISEWTENMGSSDGSGSFGDDTAGLTTSGGSTRGRSAGTGQRGMSETGGGNASLGAHSGGGGTGTTASGRGRAQSRPTT